MMTKECYNEIREHFMKEMERLSKLKQMLENSYLDDIEKFVRTIGLVHGKHVVVSDKDGFTQACSFNGVHIDNDGRLYLEFSYDELLSKVDALFGNMKRPSIMDVDNGLVINIDGNEYEYDTLMSQFV